MYWLPKAVCKIKKSERKSGNLHVGRRSLRFVGALSEELAAFLRFVNAE